MLFSVVLENCRCVVPNHVSASGTLVVEWLVTSNSWKKEIAKWSYQRAPRMPDLRSTRKHKKIIKVCSHVEPPRGSNVCLQTDNTDKLSAVKTERLRAVRATGHHGLFFFRPIVYVIRDSPHCDKLADIDYFLPRKLVTEVIYVLQGCLLYSLNGNVHWREIPQ